MNRFALTTVCSLAMLVVTTLPMQAGAADTDVEVVMVVAHPLSGEGLSQAADVVEGDELLRESQGTIGATLANQPGIHAASFGQASSRPIVHGLGGARVRVMEDRIDAMDASVTSPDHAVTVDAFIADRIEILKGPASLLYGSGAIGGVVDVHTGRIPHRVPERPLSGRFEMRVGDNADQSSTALRLDAGGGAMAWHVDGFARDAGNYDIPGFAESARQRQSEPGDADEPELRGTVPGSHLEQRGGALGVSWIGDRGFAGAAIGVTDNNYGLPGGHDHDGETGVAPTASPTLAMEQTRLDIEAAFTDPLPGFDNINLRIGVNDYEHREKEPSGEIATTVSNEAFEARLEASHGADATWTGTAGFQVGGREFSATGEEAFVPPVDSTSIGVFWVGERSFDRMELETGARVERVKHDPAGGHHRDFTGYGVSLGLVLPHDSGWQLGMHSDYSARAPVAEELYSDGQHLATRTYELGDPGLDVERAFNLSATLQYSDEKVDFTTTLYRTDFDSFIYERFSGEIRDELPVATFTQHDAVFAGLDIEALATVASWSGGRLRLRAAYDKVDADLAVRGNDNLPRIPPARVAGGLRLELGRMDAAIDYSRVAAIHAGETAALELPTDGYGDLRVHVGADIPFGTGSLRLFLQGRNLTDAEQRPHTSFIKDFVPLPGRTVEAGLRLTF